jgi:membrane associated rhomboid family serine protease
MLPVGDDNSAERTFPIVNYGLILINFLFFFVELSAGDAFIEKWSVVPQRLLAAPTGQFITIFTAMFMHAGWMHILGNMLYLWIFGDNVEDRLGHIRYLIFYLLCGVAAMYAQVLVDPHSNVPNLGASGAIAGVLGAYLLMFPHGSVRVLMGRGIIPMPAIVVIGFWAVLQFLSGFGAIATTEQTGGGGVAYMAHVGGFIAGLILAVIMGGTGREPRLGAY